MTFCHKHPSAAYAPHCAECEIERLQAVNAELLAALTEARCWIIGGVPMKNGAKCETFGEMLEMVDAAIPNHNGATE